MKHLFPIMTLMVAPLMGMARLKSGFVEANFDKSVRPADDFYQFATGGWQKKHPLPAAYPHFGSFDQLAEDNNKRINTILSELRKKMYKKGTMGQKLSDFYKFVMDADRRNKEGIKPVKPLLDEMEAAKTKKDLEQLQLKYAAQGYGVSSGSYFAADEKNVTMNILNISQSGLTLGQKDYYLDSDAAIIAIRNEYKKHIARMFNLYGFDEARAQAKADVIFKTETTLALISKSMTGLRDSQANYNKIALREFKANYPNINLEGMANAGGVKNEYIQTMAVGQPSFPEGYDELSAAATADDLRAPVEWDVIMSSSGYLIDAVREASFNFFGKTMSGRKEDYPLWKRVTNQVETQIGEALGKMYVVRYFSESSKEKMENLVRNLRIISGQRIDAQTWMSDTTKAEAHKKLDKFYMKISYPNKWRGYSKLNIDPAKSLYENVIACRQSTYGDHIAERAGKPTDRDEWFMTP